MRAQRDFALSLAWLVPLVVYIASCYHAVGFWDVGEMDTVPWILGIPHPTGFPAFVLVGWLFTHAFPFGTVAYRMSLLSALSLSLAAWLIARIVDEECDSPWIAAASAWVFAFGDITWARATRAEVHAFATLAIVATLYCALRWLRTRDVRFFVGTAAAWAAGIATHPVAALIAPGLLVVFAVGMWRKHISLRALALSIGVFVTIVCGCYAYLPLRSAYVTAHHLDPTRSLGLPPGGAFWDYDHPATLRGFRTLVTGSEFDVKEGLQAIVQPETFANGGSLYVDDLASEYTPFGLAIIILGVICGFVRARAQTIALLLAGFASVAFALGYSGEADSERYFLTSLCIASIFMGYGAAWLIAQWRFMRIAAPLGLVAIAVWLISSGRDFFLQPYDDRGATTILNVQRATPSDAIVIAPWTYATPLAYAAYVEHSLQNRTLVAAWVDDEVANIPRWMQHRPVYVLDTIDVAIPGYRYEVAARGPDVYRVVKQ